MSEAELIDQAIALHGVGRLDEAADLYDRILQSHPNHFDALHMLGVVNYQRGDVARAAALIRQAIALDGTQASPHNHLGLVLLRQGKLEEAAASFDRALEADPASAQAHNNLGTVRRWQGRLEEAAASYHDALALDPHYANAHLNLGQIRRAQGDLQGAVDSLRQGTSLDPASADGLACLAEVLLALGQPSEAVSLFQEAVGLSPGRAAWQCGLGDALHTLGELARARTAYRDALALDETCLPAWWGMGCAESRQGEYASAAASFGRAIAIAPGHGQAYHNLGKALHQLGQIDEAIEAFRRAAALLHPADQSLGTIATIIPGSPRADNRAILEARQAWAATGAPAHAFPVTFVRRREATDRRLKVGYVSAFFQHRNWMKPVWGLVNHHDRDRFEVHLLSDGPRSGIEHGYREHQNDRFHDLSGLSNAEAARVIEAEGIEVLVDLNGYSRLSRLPLLALRPAPVLVAWFNLFAPSGLDCFDYLIGDRHVLPPGEEKFYSERVIRLPGCYLAFEVTYPVPDVAPAPWRSRRRLTFGCLCPQHKITPEVVEVWSRILGACPGSRLLLKNGVLNSRENRRFVHDLFARFGVSRDRVEMEGPAEHFTFLGRYADVDLALDPFPYNGGTTTMEALWQGVPVLTFSGDRWGSRIGASLMRNAGLAEFVAPDLDGYVTRAVEVASDPDTPARLDELRRTMRERLRRWPVCDVHAFAQDMEREYLRMWHHRHER